MGSLLTWYPVCVVLMFLWQPFILGLENNPCKGLRHGMVSHPQRCESFIECYAGMAYEKECSLGLHFNPYIKACDYPEKSGCIHPNSVYSNKSDDQPQELHTDPESESEDQQGEPQDFLSAPLSADDSLNKDKQMDYGRATVPVYRNHQNAVRYPVSENRQYIKPYPSEHTRRVQPTRTHAHTTYNYYTPRPTYSSVYSKPTLAYPSSRPQPTLQHGRNKQNVQTGRGNYRNYQPSYKNYQDNHNQRGYHTNQQGHSKNAYGSSEYDPIGPLYGRSSRTSDTPYNEVHPTSYRTSPTESSYMSSLPIPSEGHQSTQRGYKEGRTMTSDYYPTFSFEAPPKNQNEFYPSSSRSPSSYPSSSSYPSQKSYSSDRDYFTHQQPRYQPQSLQPAPTRTPPPSKPQSSSYPTFSYPQERRKGGVGMGSRDYGKGSSGYGRSPQDYGKSPDGYDYPDPWPNDQGYNEGQDQYGKEPNHQNPIHSPDNVEGNPDGDSEHHGRKPPDFDNFPFGFLPKHLTGPLGDVPKAVPQEDEPKMSNVGEMNSFPDSDKSLNGLDKAQSSSRRSKRSTNWFADMVKNLGRKNMQTQHKGYNEEAPFSNKAIVGTQLAGITGAFDPHLLSAHVDLDSITIEGLHGSIWTGSDNASIGDQSYGSVWHNAITNTSLPEAKELNSEASKGGQSLQKDKIAREASDVSETERISQDDPHGPFLSQGRSLPPGHPGPHIQSRQVPRRFPPPPNPRFSRLPRAGHPPGGRPPRPRPPGGRPHGGRPPVDHQRVASRRPPRSFPRAQPVDKFFPRPGPPRRRFRGRRVVAPYNPFRGLDRYRVEAQIANVHLPSGLGTREPVISNHNNFQSPNIFQSSNNFPPFDTSFPPNEGPPIPYPSPPRASEGLDFLNRHPDSTFEPPRQFPGYIEQGFSPAGRVPQSSGFDPDPGFHVSHPGPLSVREMKSFSTEAMNDAKFAIRDRLRHEADMSQRMQGIVDSQPFRYVSAFLNAKPYAKYLSHAASSMLEALKIMRRRHNLSGTQIHQLMDDMPSNEVLKIMDDPVTPDTVFPVPPDIDYCPYPNNYLCDVSKRYRTVDGTCNNLDKPLWGRSMLPHRRLLPAVYADGIEAPRESVLGGPLPGARFVSSNAFRDQDRPSSLHTLMLMIWGQFVDHDMTRTAISKVTKDEHGYGPTEDVKCGFDGCQTGLKGQEACWPIPVPHDDEDFGGKKCLKFVRSQEVPPISCKYGPREQLNQVTSWMDASHIYGSTKEEMDGLRDYSDPGRGRMAITLHPHGPFYKPLLPQDDVELCRGVNLTIRCFKAGDERVNEQVALTAMHTAWVREHNRIEQIFNEINPHWHGETLFQETRRVIGAMNQHIVFNEYLPLILGPKVIKQYDLELATDGYYYGYDPTTDPRASNSFGAAAFRFGHTLIQERFRRSGFSYEPDDSLMLSMAFRRPVHVYDTSRGGVDSLVRGMCDFPAQNFDTFFTKQITRSLFTEDPPFGLGMDLLSLNIQRGRDHGIPSYNAMREFCGMKRARDFEDLADEIPNPETRNNLRRIYKHVEDIDLFPGGISEQIVEGGQVGPTFACIIANEFQSSRKGDRFWYENDNEAGFSPSQLQEIRKARLAQVLCVNGDAIDVIQPWVLLKPFREVYDFLNNEVYEADKTGIPYEDFARLYDDNFNARVPCDTLPEPDWSLWRQGPYTK